MIFLVKVYVARRRVDITLEVIAESKKQAILLAKNSLRKDYKITECELDCYSCEEGRL